jgi:hypothetical protein
MFLRNSYFAAAPYAAIDACVRCAGTRRVVGIKFVVLVPLQELRVFILSHCNLLQWRVVGDDIIVDRLWQQQKLRTFESGNVSHVRF